MIVLRRRAIATILSILILFGVGCGRPRVPLSAPVQQTSPPKRVRGATTPAAEPKGMPQIHERLDEDDPDSDEARYATLRISHDVLRSCPGLAILGLRPGEEED